MQELTSKIIAILQKYMSSPTAHIGAHTKLSELEIDLLDLPMIFLDVEDVFDVQIDYHDEIEDLATIGCLVARVESGLKAKAMRPHMRRSVPRKRGNWMSTGATSRR